MILEGVRSPAEDTWLFSLMYTVELDAVGALFEDCPIIVIVIVAVSVDNPSVIV